MFIQHYWKCENLTERGITIARFLPPSISILVLTFLSVVKPKEIALLEGEKSGISRTYLFTQRGERLDAQRIRDWISNFLSIRNIPLTFSDYR